MNVFVKEKQRLDQYLTEHGLAASREKGKALVMAGLVYLNKARAEKPGTMVQPGDEVEVRGPALPYVSRGGLKLEKAIRVFALNLQSCVVLDIGASTGGFTDCALKNGALRVYAVDVGYGQLDWSLRQDARVVNLERKNARFLTKEDIPEPIDLCTIDTAFISLEKILPAVTALLKEEALVMALIKPQFEAGREKVGKKGVVKDPAVHRDVIENVLQSSQTNGLAPLNLSYSPITGPEGNIEFLLLLKKGEATEMKDSNAKIRQEESEAAQDWSCRISQVVMEAHQNLC